MEKKISLIASVLPKLSTAKLVATEMSKRPSFMQRFGSQHGNGYQTLLRSSRNHFYTTIPLIWGRTSRKRLGLVRSEVLGQFANTSTVHYNILVRIWRIYRNKFKCRYLQNQKLWFFIASMKSTLNSEYFEKKDQSQSLSITEIIDCETGSYWNV